MTTIESPRAGCGGFDYTCDGLETPEFSGSPGTMNCMPSGWVGTVPACGQRGTLCVAEVGCGCISNYPMRCY